MNWQQLERCSWANSSELDAGYHDREWGVPVHEDNMLFEMLTLEGAQAGLSWSTILKKRDGYRQAFAQFDIDTVAAYNDQQIDQLVLNPAIVRHRGKIQSTVGNARAIQAIQSSHGSFDHYIWSFVDHQPIINQWRSLAEVPGSTALSDQLSKDLKKRGFKFVGSTICYAFMQAAGLVNDHLTSCFRYPHRD